MYKNHAVFRKTAGCSRTCRFLTANYECVRRFILNTEVCERMALDEMKEFRDTLVHYYIDGILARGFVPRMPKVHMQDFGTELSGIVITHENAAEHKYAGALVTMDDMLGLRGNILWHAQPSPKHTLYANNVPHQYRIQPITGDPCDIDRYLREGIAFYDRFDRDPLLDIAMKTFILRGILDLQATPRLTAKPF